MISLVNTPSFYGAMHEVADFCHNYDNKVEIIVPDKLSLFMEKFIFEQLNISASFNIKVSTLNRFAKRNLEIDKACQISKIGAVLLMHKILNEHYNEFKIFKNKAYSFSYAEEILKTINQLKASKIDSAEMQKFKSNNAQLNCKIADLALIYDYYQQEKAGKLDASDVFLLSTQFVGKDMQNEQIIFVGFDDFTAIEYSIIERLALNNNVRVINYYSNSKNKNIFNNEVYSQLNEIAHINNIGFETINCNLKFDDLKEFLHKNLFSLENNYFNLTQKRVSIISANRVDNELELVARDIKNKIILNAKFDNFGVAVFGLENKLDKINEIFNKYDINFYVDRQLFLNKSVLYKFWCSVLKYNLEGYELTNLIDIINSPFFELEEKAKIDLIEKLNFYKFRGEIKEKTHFDIENFEILKNFIKYFTFNKATSFKDFIEKFNTAHKELNFEAMLINIAENKTNLADKLLISKSLEAISNLILEISSVYKNLSLEQFCDIFFHIANLAKINNLPLTVDAVKVVEATNCLEIFDQLYIVNCTQDNAPSLKYDCGIILDSEIDCLNFKHKLAPTIAHINKLSKLRLFNLCTMFENSITLSSSFNPSEIIKEFLNKISYKGNNVITNFKFDNYIALSKKDYLEFCYKYYKEDDFNEKNRQFYEISNKNLNIFNLKTISASQLENYFHCPFGYFLNNILKIRPRLKNDVMSVDVGNILHAILLEYYDCNKNVGDLYNFCKTQVFKYIDKDLRLKLNADSPTIKNLIDEAVRVLNGSNFIDSYSKFKPILFEHEFVENLKEANIKITGKVDRIDECGDMLRIIDYKSGKAAANLKELYYGNKLQLFLYANAMQNELKKNVVGNFYLPLHNEFISTNKANYNLNGFFVNDKEVLTSMDTRLKSELKSDILNVRLTKENKAYKTIANRELELNEMNNLKQYATDVAIKAVGEIKAGNILPSPSESVNPCRFCAYKHICLKNVKNIDFRPDNKVNLSSFKRGENG